MSFLSPKAESDVFLAIDIGSGSVGGALVLASKANAPTILYSFRSEILFQDAATGARLLSLMLRSLSQVMIAITREGFYAAGIAEHHTKVREVLVSLGAPWVISRTSFLRLSNENPTRITTRVFAGLLEHSEQELHSAHKEKEIPLGSTQIEQKLIKSILNGYETSSPYEKEAREADFCVFTSFSLPRITDRVVGVIHEHLQPKHISFHSFSLLAFATLRELPEHPEDFIIIDASGEQTEVAIVKRGILAETATFPLGRNSFIRAVRGETEAVSSGASAMLRLYAEGNGTGRAFERAKKIFVAKESEWQRELGNVLTIFSEEVFLPRMIFLTADDATMPLFSRAIGSADWSSLTLSPGSLRVTSVSAELLTSLLHWSSSEHHDPFLGLIASSGSRIRRE